MADWNPELYNRFRRYREEPFLAILERLELRGDESIVDLGCGSGENTIELARRVPRGRALGLDSSAAMIEAANKVLADVGPEVRARLSFSLGDIKQFSAQDEYAVVFSNAALQWVPGHREIFMRIHRALKPGGRVVVQMPKNDLETAQMTILQLAAESPWKEMLPAVSVPSRGVPGPEHYTRLLGEIGFADIDCYEHVFQHPMDSPRDVVDWSRATALRPFLGALPADKHDAFLSALVERLARAYGTDGPLIFPFRRLFIWATRPAL
ncbi:MAG TPA: methyltransferase domain-containing protein [Candidatus Binataceae bacterium]|nr:methyltransferase domain-containing protein [Candidatus Binataceae bacterium]